MPATRRSRLHNPVRRFALGVAAILLAGCGAAAGPSIPAASVAVVVTPPPSVAASASAAATTTPRPTPVYPTVMTRPTNIPTDGACEDGHPCLGLIAAGSHHTQLFVPGFSFTMAKASWENLAMTPGDVGLLPLDSPGDEIHFFAHPKPTKPDGTLDLSVTVSVDGIASWLAADPALTVTPAKAVTIGGLSGKVMDFALAPGTVSHPADCPVATCVILAIGRSQTWQWDWGTASSDRERMYVLTAKAGIVLIFVDSLDGTTFDALTKRADTILATVKFDK
jgi:hypothetical protein